eukprot:6185376-Pleurochrysis_carterae.AAC.1
MYVSGLYGPERRKAWPWALRKGTKVKGPTKDPSDHRCCVLPLDCRSAEAEGHRSTSSCCQRSRFWFLPRDRASASLTSHLPILTTCLHGDLVELYIEAYDNLCKCGYGILHSSSDYNVRGVGTEEGEGNIEKEKTYGIKHWGRVRTIPRIHIQ